MITLTDEEYDKIVKLADYHIPQNPDWSDDGYADGCEVLDTFCPKCGAEIDERNNFCPVCGQRINWGEWKEKMNMASWYEKWCKKNNEKAKKDYVTISRLEFLDTISSTIASLDADLEETHSLSIFGAIVAEKIFDKQETNEGKDEKADD